MLNLSISYKISEKYVNYSENEESNKPSSFNVVYKVLFVKFKLSKNIWLNNTLL